MLDLSLFRNSTFAGANIVALLVTLAMFGVFFFMSLYVQQILGYSPVEAGAIFLPMTVLIMLVAPLAGKLSDHIGSRWLMAGGLSLVGGSLMVFSRLGTDSGFWDMLPGLLVGGIGMALVMTPMTAAAMGSVPVDKAGVVLRRPQYVPAGGRRARHRDDGRHPDLPQTDALASGASPPEAFVDGFQVALLVGAVIVFVGALSAALLIRKVQHLEPALEAAG